MPGGTAAEALDFAVELDAVVLERRASIPRTLGIETLTRRVKPDYGSSSAEPAAGVSRAASGAPARRRP
jgi:hypothetical protein